MFGGGHVTIPANSPHLRKSGSRQLFSDLGETKYFISPHTEFIRCLFFEILLFRFIETSDMKLAAGTPLATAAMLPSPVLLWRLKVANIYV